MLYSITYKKYIINLKQKVMNMDCTVEEALCKLIIDKSIEIYGATFYKEFKEGAKNKDIKFLCARHGNYKYKIDLFSYPKEIQIDEDKMAFK